MSDGAMPAGAGGCGCGAGCDCACCKGIADLTPVETTNLPGLAAIAYRVGTHATFKATMLARLSSSHEPALAGLRTREDDDLAIALLDAWATVGDVLTFYQERIANECYLRTATERRSLLELSRLIGYELGPGVAASTVLAFTIEDTSGAAAVPIPAGTKVQSLPRAGQQPQTFETRDAIDARAEWNTIQARQTQPQALSTTMRQIVLSGVSLNLKAGDALLISVSGQNAVRWISQVYEPDRVAQQTTVMLEDVPATEAPSPVAWGAALHLPPGGGTVALSNLVDSGVVPQREAETDARIFGLFRRQIDAVFAAARMREYQLPPGDGVYAFRARASIFGHNAPAHAFLKSVNSSVSADDPDAGNLTTTVHTPNFDIDLDGSFPGIVNGSWVVLADPGVSKALPYVVNAHAEGSRAAYAISGNVTSLALSTTDGLEGFTVRGTTVLAQSESLTPADLPMKDPVAGGSLMLAGALLGLEAGRLVVVSGTPVTPGDVPSETAEIASVDMKGGYTVLNLKEALLGTYVRSTVTICANVARATHGETVSEVVGSGDAARPYPQFTLRQAPLTYVSAATPTGRESTLALRVNDILWHEVPTLYGHGPRDRVFITRHSDDNKATIYAGDGRSGARFPSGVENIKATYRKGTGAAGLVDAGQLSLLMSRPLGVKAVTNPEPSTGAEDPETTADAKRNAPVTVRTLERVVSLQDYEDFARAFGGIGKALATWTWSGQARGVFLTVAGVAGAAVAADGTVAENLLTALRSAGDPYLGVRVASFQPAFFRLSARVSVDPDYLPARVLEAVESALEAAFSFDNRSFGQAVALSEVEAIMQGVDGVIAVLVDRFSRFGDSSTGAVADRLPAAAPRPGGDAATVVAAELLLLDLAGADLMALT